MTSPAGRPASPASPSTPTPVTPTATVLHGDCIQVMRTMPDNSVDSIVTDPPYEISFMGRSWDGSGVAFDPETWREAMRVLKPGGHLIAFGGTRTWHRLAVAIEDAGFEIRDSLAWLYGSGFPKSLDVSKAIDKAAGAQREVVGTKLGQPGYHLNGHDGGKAFGHGLASTTPETRLAASQITAPATTEAETWQGWGTALKPAFEPCVVARKPLAAKTVAANVLEYGTGALNIDACRIGTSDTWSRAASETSGRSGGIMGKQTPKAAGEGHTAGRWPANVLLDESQAAALDEQSGISKTAPRGKPSMGKPQQKGHGATNIGNGLVNRGIHHGDEGGASRFFYVAKAPKRERPVIEHADGTRTAHPTVKPLALMRMLCRLITPPGGTVLEPFAGSGTTIEAALLEGFSVIGIEMTDEYLPLIQARIDRVTGTPTPVEAAPVVAPVTIPAPVATDDTQAVLF